MLNKEVLLAFADWCESNATGYYEDAALQLAEVFMMNVFGLTQEENWAQDWSETAHYVRRWVEEHDA